MVIALKKFGTTLTSRQLGKEAFAAFQPALDGITKSERIEIDFEGVDTFSPSWADEFLTPLAEKYPGTIILNPSENLSVKLTLELLENTTGKKFQYK